MPVANLDTSPTACKSPKTISADYSVTDILEISVIGKPLARRTSPYTYVACGGDAQAFGTISLNRNSIRRRESNGSVGVTSVDDLVADGDVTSGKITRSVTSNNRACGVGAIGGSGRIAYLASSGDGIELGIYDGSRALMSCVDNSAVSNHCARNRAAIARGDNSARYVWQRDSAIRRGVDNGKRGFKAIITTPFKN